LYAGAQKGNLKERGREKAGRSHGKKVCVGGGLVFCGRARGRNGLATLPGERNQDSQVRGGAHTPPVSIPGVASKEKKGTLPVSFHEEKSTTSFRIKKRGGGEDRPKLPC